jgi:hypothetical protein
MVLSDDPNYYPERIRLAGRSRNALRQYGVAPLLVVGNKKSRKSNSHPDQRSEFPRWIGGN